MPAAVSRRQFDDAVSLTEKAQFTVVDAGGGAEAQHIPLQGNPFQRQMFADIALNQIGNRVRDGEIGHGPWMPCCIASSKFKAGLMPCLPAEDRLRHASGHQCAAAGPCHCRKAVTATSGD